MRIARMLSPVHSLGPGERVALWVQGCTRGCPGCISPELQPHSAHDTAEPLLAEILRKTARYSGCTGLTISGGEPFEQAEGLERLLGLVRDCFEDILVYTGFSLEELRMGACGRAGTACLEKIDVLVDGPYVESRNERDCVLRGSSNQTVHVLRPGLEERYRDYMERGRLLENFIHDGTVIITGIPDRRDRL